GGAGHREEQPRLAARRVPVRETPGQLLGQHVPQPVVGQGQQVRQKPVDGGTRDGVAQLAQGRLPLRSLFAHVRYAGSPQSGQRTCLRLPAKDTWHPAQEPCWTSPQSTSSGSAKCSGSGWATAA